MHHRRSFRLALGLLVMLGACTDATGPVQSLEVSLTTSSAIVHVDEPVAITITAVNQGNSPVEVIANPCPEAYRVTTPNGEVVAPGAAVCTAAATIRVLQPGERLEFSYSWGGTTREQINGSAVQLPAGAYQLHGVVMTRGEEIASAAVTIHVQP